MQSPGHTGKNRAARGAGLIAYRDHVIKIEILHGLDVLGFLAGDVHARFGHHLHGIGVKGFGINAETYSGTAVFNIPVRVVSKGAGGKLALNVRYQACNGEICLPPKTVRVEL